TVLLGGGTTKAPAAAGNHSGVPAPVLPGTTIQPTGGYAEPSAPATTPGAATTTTHAPAPTKAPPTTKAPAAPGGALAHPAEEGAVLSLVNKFRGEAGCKPLTFDAKLSAAARKHSLDMATRRYFSHDTPEGVSMADRITDEGFRWSMVGENIAEGQRDANAVMTAWMNSPG